MEASLVAITLSLFAFLLEYRYFFASLFTLTLISVNRLLALLLGIRYRKVVTFKRVLLVVIIFGLYETLALLLGEF